MTADATPLRIAIVGSGPAGYYAAGHLLASGVPLEVDLFERLPTPWGLVRFGVAPDHPKIKEVARIFDKTARDPRFRFFGNVDVGRDVSHDELRSLYGAVVYAVGARSDRRLGIAGEDLPGSRPATEFVAWYNGHPDARDARFDLGVERVAVVGAGNVAIDVARMLALTPAELAVTDTADYAIAALAASRVREVVVLARRGPVQAAFTTPELKELGELAGADVVVDPADLALDPASEAALADDPTAQRNLAILRDYAARVPSGKPKTLHLRFLVSPVEIAGQGKVETLTIARNRLVADGHGGVRAEPTGDRDTIRCGLVLRSVGYKGAAIPGVPFDDARGTIPNEAGRALDGAGRPIDGLYCVGWIKRGPSGVIGTNKKDAAETVERLVEDVRAGTLARSGEPRERIDALLASRGVRPVDQAGWEAIDAHERALGAAQGRPRVKLTLRDELLAVASRRA